MPPNIQRLIYRERNQRYTMAIPDGYTGADAVPLVIALHYQGYVTPFFGEGILVGLIEPALRDLGALVAAPDCQHEYWDNPESESEVIGLIEYLLDKYAIDNRRIVLSGYSMGGRGTWYIAGRHQDTFAAAIPISASPTPHASEFDWKVPLYVIQSRADEIVPFEETRRIVSQLRQKGTVVEFAELDGITHYETDLFIEPTSAVVPWLRRMWGGR